MTSENIPKKLYYRIGEVSKILNVDTYTLRYWETQFKNFIKPERTTTNQRRYTQKDIERIRIIRDLLYKNGYTIEGARKKLLKESDEIKKKEKLQKSLSQLEELLYILKELKVELNSLKGSLK